MWEGEVISEIEFLQLYDWLSASEVLEKVADADEPPTIVGIGCLFLDWIGHRNVLRDELQSRLVGGFDFLRVAATQPVLAAFD